MQRRRPKLRFGGSIWVCPSGKVTGVKHPQEPFVVPVATLREGVNRLYLEGGPEDGRIPPGDADLVGKIVLEGDFIRSDKTVEIQAQVEATVRQVCGRCLKSVESTIDTPLRLYCERRGKRDSLKAPEDRAEDSGLLYYDGQTLDLRDEIRQVVLLEVPWYPLCDPDCRGLCPICGHDKNTGGCECTPHRAPGPWDALRGMIEAEGHPPDASREKE